MRQGRQQVYSWVSWGLLGLLTWLVMRHATGVQHADQWVFGVLHHHLASGGIHWFLVFSTLGSPVVTTGLVLILAGWAWWRGHRRRAGGFTLAILGADALAWGLKQLVARPRPSAPLVPDTGYSFPSGHVLSAMILALVIWWLLAQGVRAGHLRWRLDLLVGVGVLVILVSRLYLRDHYPSDTVASLLLAVGWWEQVRFWWPLSETSR